jgi:probable DNA metabolism protein
MTRYIFDGSFDGFLSAAARAMGLDDVCIAAAGCPQGELFSTDIPVVTNTTAAHALLHGFETAAGGEEADMLLLAQASPDPDVPMQLFCYMLRVLHLGHSAAADISRPEVRAVRKARDRVMLEINKFLGFVRFVKTGDGLYYAAMEPDNNIAGFIGPIFADRLRDQDFLIHDRTRGIAFWHRAGRDGGSGGIAELAELPPELDAAVEADADRVQALWREYFGRIAIAQRRNPALQARLMPKRYWKHLTEVQDKMKGK